MSDEDFLARWSRRKREVPREEQAARTPSAETVAASPPVPAADRTEPPFDPESLPPIDSINALSDITAFLRDGVPADLTRAALRRAWTADPSIRDFIGLAENAWDFTDPAAMPGFGPLENTEQVRQLIAQVVGEISRSVQPGDANVAGPHADRVQISNHSNVIVEGAVADESAPEGGQSEDEQEQVTAQGLGDQASLQSNTDNTALQHDSAKTPAEAKRSPHLSHRTHGGALPR